ncbi:MAG: NifU family protein [Deltaproteobacteria bacterium]|nr:NifU family protein [Deltaproteobacteria bacterium]
MSEKADGLKAMLREVLAPMLRSDGSDLYLVDLSKKELRLHITGKLSGGPGTPAVIENVIAPAVAAIDDRIKVFVSSGYLVPKTAERIEPS